jgi:hypothetical protein
VAIKNRNGISNDTISPQKIITLPKKLIIKAQIILNEIFSFKKIKANMTVIIGMVKLISVSTAIGTFVIHKFHNHIPQYNIKPLKMCIGNFCVFIDENRLYIITGIRVTVAKKNRIITISLGVISDMLCKNFTPVSLTTLIITLNKNHKLPLK